MLCELTFFFAISSARTFSLYTCIYSQTYLYYIIQTPVYEPMLCKLTNGCALAGAHTWNLFVFTHMLTSRHISYYRYSCIWLRVVWTHICLCPCECSHLEPLCIHACTYKNTQITSQIDLYMSPCCANSQMSVPLRVLTLRTSLYTWTHKCLCVCECSHLEPLCIHTYAHKYTYLILQILYFCVWLRVVRTHICLCSCERSHLEPLCRHAYTHKYTYHIKDTFILFCKLTYVCSRASAHTQNVFVYIHILTSIHMKIQHLRNCKMSPHFWSARCSGMLHKNQTKHRENSLCPWVIHNPGIFPMRMERIDKDFLHLQDVLCRSFSYCRPLPSLPKVVPHGSTGRGYMPQTPPPVQELWTSEAQEIVRTMFQSDFTELGYSQDRLPAWHRNVFWKFLVFSKKGGHATYYPFPFHSSTPLAHFRTVPMYTL